MTAVPVESDEAPNAVLQSNFFKDQDKNSNRLGVLEKAAKDQTAGIIVQTVTNGDTDHSPSGDAVHDFGLGLIASAVTDGDTAHAPSGNAVHDYIAGIILTATASLDFASIPPGTVQTAAMTVTGAAENDTVMLGAPSGLVGGLIAFGRVSAADTVTIRLFNSTGGAIDPAAQTWRATVLKL